jgi:hypothetical protein
MITWAFGAASVVLFAYAALAAPSAPTGQRGCDLPAEVRAARAALGPVEFGELRALGAIQSSGVRGKGEIDDNLTDGRTAQRFHIPVQGDYATIFDGSARWQQDVSGGVHPLDAPFARQLAITDAYLARRGFLNANEPATLRCIGKRKIDGKLTLLIRAYPRGGRPADLAFDPITHLLTSVSERLPTTTQVTRYSDYREIHGLTLPFEVRSGTLFEPNNGFVLLVRRYDLVKVVHAPDFAKPKETDALLMLGGSRFTTVPLKIEGHQLFVWAAINGHVPMPFILDSGGHAILTTKAARTLGIRAVGAGESGGSGAGTIGVQFANVNTVRIGNAELRDQHFLVIPYPYSFYERGRKTPLAGILGLEFFERFAIHIDYGRNRLTLTPLDRFRYRGTGVAVRIRFQEDVPLALGAVDEHPGSFEVDTGNAGTLILFGPFIARTGLNEIYRTGFVAIGHGTGGSNSGRIETIRSFSIGGQTLHRVRSDFTQMSSGTFSSWTEAGNFGYSVLLHYSPTFDYARGLIYLERNARAPANSPNRSGFAFEKNGPAAFDVASVRPNSAASAVGITPGDTIIAINGRPAADYSWADLADLTSQSPGTRLYLKVHHNGTARDVTVTLR